MPDDDWDEHDEIDLVTAEGYMLEAGQDPDAARTALEQRIRPQVLSDARPEADWLRDARALLNGNKAIRDFVREARSGGMAVDAAIDGLSIRLNEQWGGDRAAEAFEVATYLWDEQDQLGDGIYLVSRETGRVAVRLTENDIYQPKPVPREDGSLATPLPRIRPDIEAGIACWFHDESREDRIVATLAARAHQTQLLREDGDPRLLVATREGRRHMVESLGKFDPKVLLRAAGGTSGAFLQRFELRAEDPEETEGLQLIDGGAYSQTTMNIQDQTTVNLHHNRAASIQGALVQGWVREVARQLSLEAVKHFPQSAEIHQMDLTKGHLQGIDLWITSPETLRYLRRVQPNLSVMPVASARTIGVRPHAGVLVVPAEFKAMSRELFDRWEASSSLKFRIWVDWTKVVILTLGGVEYQATLV